MPYFHCGTLKKKKRKEKKKGQGLAKNSLDDFQKEKYLKKRHA